MELDTVTEGTDLSLKTQESDTKLWNSLPLIKRNAINLESIFRGYLLTLNNASTMTLPK
jgi:hypothetical protein